MERHGFKRLLEKLETGDVLLVTKLDRLGRNAMDVRKTVEHLESQGVRVHCLALGGVDLTSAAGKMTMQVLGAVAEFERDLLIERTQAGGGGAPVLRVSAPDGQRRRARPRLCSDSKPRV